MQSTQGRQSSCAVVSGSTEMRDRSWRPNELASHCRTPLLLSIGASIGALLLGLHIGFGNRLFSGQLVRRVQRHFGAVSGISGNASASHHQQLICNTFSLQPQHASGNVTYNPAGISPDRAADGVRVSTLKAPRLHMCWWQRCPTLAVGVFDPRHGWVVIFRHEEGYEVPTWPLTMFMGHDPNALDLGMALDRQTILTLDDETLGPKGAAARGKPWLKAEDLRCGALPAVGPDASRQTAFALLSFHRKLLPAPAAHTPMHQWSDCPRISLPTARPFMWNGSVYVGHSLWVIFFPLQHLALLPTSDRRKFRIVL